MFAGFKEWWKNPYADNMPVTRWFLFVGLLIVILAVWKIIIAHLMDA